MRRIFITAALAILPAFAQPNIAPPNDPHDPITASGQTPQQVETVQQRAAATTLLIQASDHYAMHAKGTPAHVLQMSFNTTASTLYPAATGQLTETWISGQNWRWDGSLGNNYMLLRISSNGVAYDQTANQPMPIHMKMLANAVFAPEQNIAPRTQPMRTASVPLNGTQVTCILLRAPLGDQPPQSGRNWDEAEYCVDATGLLRVYSEVPGIFAFYDYSNALKFHDRILPGAVTIEENGATVAQAQLTSIADTDAANAAPFTPTAQMVQQGPATVLFLPTRSRRYVSSQNVAVDAAIQPVIVHATLDAKGNVQESELLQTTSMSAQALDLIKQSQLMPAPETSGTPPRQREAFVRVEYGPMRGLARGLMQ